MLENARVLCGITLKTMGKSMNETDPDVLAQMKELTIIEPAVTLRGAMKPGDVSALEALAKALMA